MINKTISVSSVVRDKDNVNDVIHMNCDINANLRHLNISLHIANLELYKENTDLLKTKFKEFLEQSLQEAVASGWDILDIDNI